MITEDPPRSPLIAQPPSDRTIGNASMFHYTVRSKGGEWEEGGAMKLEQGAEYRGERGGKDKVGVSVGGRPAPLVNGNLVQGVVDSICRGKGHGGHSTGPGGSLCLNNPLPACSGWG